MEDEEFDRHYTGENLVERGSMSVSLSLSHSHSRKYSSQFDSCHVRE